MKIIIVFLAFVLLSSCDPYTPGSLKITNSSDDTLLLSLLGWGDSTIIIHPNESVLYHEFVERGKPKYFDCCPCVAPISSFSPLDSNKTITKQYHIKNNWLIFMENEFANCNLTITNNDIQ